MLVKVAVKGFRNFNNWFEFDFRSRKAYEFNSNVLRGDLIKHSMVYGKNGKGKSNLGLAILDITCHLNDVNVLPSLSSNYLNADSESELAEFKYQFDFDGIEVVYEYGKSDFKTTVYEKLTIDSELVLQLDRRDSDIAKFGFIGAESLRNDFSSRAISAVKFISSSALLADNTVNSTFFKFIEFVAGMVFFRTLNRNKEFHGQVIDSKRLSQAIIEKGKVKDFEEFLNASGVECKLQINGPKYDEVIEFVFGSKNIEFSLVASTGTMSLGVFYYWYLKLLSNEISFAFIDEFDAYYHFSLSKNIVRKLSELQCQTVLTTHNISLMSNELLRPDCYFLLDDVQKPFYSLVDKELRKAHNLEKIYKGLS
ncbi:ATP-binding protein [Pseudoalteromonas luteoviolacea]|uniref:ATP-binding protein n=1 Tax=Pseudoalteromonas luteoviolacea TaxID=43657 RepID=UPI001F20D088|nr:ATP-binding protein [Pseudoalteromonas luteoviolacea]MCF6439731.1 ATP-binding protein [Pseudoalteromonas luteoviolacea]